MGKMGATTGVAVTTCSRIAEMALAVFLASCRWPVISRSLFAILSLDRRCAHMPPCYTPLQSVAFRDASAHEEEEGEFFVAPVSIFD